MQISWVFSDIYVSFRAFMLSIITELDGSKASLSHPEVITRFSGVSNKSPFRIKGQIGELFHRIIAAKTKDALSMTGGCARYLNAAGRQKDPLILHARINAASL